MINIYKIYGVGLVALTMLCMFSPVAHSASDLAKAAQNPIANMISLPLQNNTNYNAGAYERTQNTLNIQPVWPITLNEDWNFITRTIVPVVSQPIGVSERGIGSGRHYLYWLFLSKWRRKVDMGCWAGRFDSPPQPMMRLGATVGGLVPQ